MPTTPVTTFSNNKLDPLLDGEDALEYAVSLVGPVTYVKGTVLGEVSATPGTFKAYASGSSDGSQVPKCILRDAVTVDASGNITIPGENNMIRLDTHAFFAGTFACADLTGLDANALTAGGWRLINGSVTTGAVRLG